MNNLQHIYISNYDEKLDCYYAEGYPYSFAAEIINEAIGFLQDRDSVMRLQVDELVALNLVRESKFDEAIDEYNEKLYEAVKKENKEK